MYSVISSDGRTYGPVDVSTLKDWCVQGRVTPDTNVIDGVSGRTMRAVDLQDLYGLFQGPPQAPSYGGSQIHQQSGPPPGAPFVSSYVNPPSPYMNNSPYVVAGPPKSKVAAALLAFFLGGLGVHRFYMGYTAIGLAMLLMSLFGWVLLFIPNIVVGVWVIVDFILILTGGLNDAQGQPLTA